MYLKHDNNSMHPRRQRWAALLLFVFCSLLLLWYFPLTLLPTTPHIAKSRSNCPATPPYPVVHPQRDTGFDWRRIKTQNPAQPFVQLSRLESKPQLPQVQYNFRKESPEAQAIRTQRQATVKETFQRAWTSYKEHAWMKDELTPISGGSKTTFSGWGATLVDSLDTLWIMDLKEEFADAVTAVEQIDFQPEGTVNVFETTIRYLGGLLAAYDLTDCKDTRLLGKAVELGDMIYASFDTPNRMPVTRWDSVKASKGQQQEAAANGIIAEMASFSLEFIRLSQLTGDMRYYDAVARVTDVLDAQQNRTKLPGLWPVGIDVRAPDLTTGDQFSLGAMADSAYEYLGKTFQLLQGHGAAMQYKRMYEQAMEAVIQHLLFRPMTPDQVDVLMPTSVRVTSPSEISQDHGAQHLVCFVGGMFALGGRLFENPAHVDIGRKVTDACVWSYRNAPNGIMPEMFSMPACPTHESCVYDASIPQRYPGFADISDARYNLRPEAIESVFYMYRITGDTSYQDVAWEMFQAIDNLTRTPFANAAVRDVTLEREKIEQDDSMESFWLAETLKYFYLVFSEPGLVSLDEWVLNTEAHPFRLVS